MISRCARGLAAWAIRSPRLAIGVWLAAAAASLPGVALLHVDTRTDSVLDKADPAWRFYEQSVQRFGGDEVVVVAIESAEPLDPRLLGDLPELSRKLAKIGGVRRVDSLATVPVIRAEPNGTLRLDPAVVQGAPQDPDDIARLIEGDRILRDLLVSRDRRTTALNVYMEANSSQHYERVVREVRRLVEPYDAWVSGVPVFRADTNIRTVEEIIELVPATLVVLIAVLWIALRSVSGVLIPLATAGLGVLLVLGIMGVANSSFSLSTLVLPTILLALGCAYSMHVVVAAGRTADETKRTEGVCNVATPVLISGITTAVGFGSMCVVRIEAIRSVGIFGCIGAAILCLAALTFCVAATQLFGGRDVSYAVGLERFAHRGAVACVELVDRRWLVVVLGWSVAAASMAVGIKELRLETDVTQWFRKGTEMRDSYEEIRRRLSGISPMNVVVKAKDGSLVTSDEALNLQDGLTRFLEERGGVGRALSVVDPLRQLHGGFLGDSAQPLPGEEVVEQYLLLLESMPQIDDLISKDRSTANVVILADDNGSQNLLMIARAVDRWWREHASDRFEARVTGVMYEFARAQGEISRGQIVGLSVAVVVIGLILFAVFRDARIAMMAMLPNVVPVIFAFGVMGVLGIPLDAGTILIGSLALGVAVDDTVHVVSVFQRFRGRGIGKRKAMDLALREVMPAVTITTAAIAVSLGLLGLSDFSFVRNLGLVTAGAMGLCLLADLNLLPALLIRYPRGDTPW